MKVTARFTLEVPDGTDPQHVLEVVNRELDSAADGGGLVQWGNWDYSAAELDVEVAALDTSAWTPPPDRVTITYNRLTQG